MRYQRAGVVETGLYLASINTAGILGHVDTAQFIGGRIRRDNNPTPGRADVFCFTNPALGQVSALLSAFTSGHLVVAQYYACSVSLNLLSMNAKFD